MVEGGVGLLEEVEGVCLLEVKDFGGVIEGLLEGLEEFGEGYAFGSEVGELDFAGGLVEEDEVIIWCAEDGGGGGIRAELDGIGFEGEFNGHGDLILRVRGFIKGL